MINSAGIFFNDDTEIIVEATKAGEIIRCENVKRSPGVTSYKYPKNVTIRNNSGAAITINYAQIDGNFITVNYQSFTNGTTRTVSNTAIINGCIYVRTTSNNIVTATNATVESVSASSGLAGYHFYIKPIDYNSVVAITVS